MLFAVGVLLLAYGLLKANALVSFGTSEELASERDGRRVVYFASALLVVAAALLAARFGSTVALAAGGLGVVCTALVALSPQSAYGLLAFLVLGPAASLMIVMRLAGG